MRGLTSLGNDFTTSCEEQDGETKNIFLRKQWTDRTHIQPGQSEDKETYSWQIDFDRQITLRTLLFCNKLERVAPLYQTQLN